MVRCREVPLVAEVPEEIRGGAAEVVEEPVPDIGVPADSAELIEETIAVREPSPAPESRSDDAHADDVAAAAATDSEAKDEVADRRQANV